MAVQFLVEGINKYQENGVFVTFEESAQEITSNVSSFGWNVSQYIEEGKLAFVDASPVFNDETLVAGEYDLAALLSRIELAARNYSAKRVSIDTVSALFGQLPDKVAVRRELHRITAALRKIGVTVMLTGERLEEYGPIARHGVEEFVADNVIILRNVLEEEKRRRTIEILKFRGATHQKGEFPFTIDPHTGIIVIPISAIELRQRSSDVRISSGISELDGMCGGGFFRDSIILVSGATGTGKTLMVSHFLAGDRSEDPRCLVFAFEESREQLFRNAIGWGMDFEELEQQGRLKVVCDYPEVASLEDHLVKMKDVIDEFKPTRVAVDSLSALERISTVRGFREFVIGLTSFIKHKEIAGLFTSTTPTLMGGSSVTEAHISTITDSIILLRYVEIYGEMRRGLTVLKMRGSVHNKQIREFTIDGKGMHIGDSFKNITGILAGSPSYLQSEEFERLSHMFE
jgi:circadian clock protein KaiC